MIIYGLWIGDRRNTPKQNAMRQHRKHMGKIIMKNDVVPTCTLERFMDVLGQQPREMVFGVYKTDARGKHVRVEMNADELAAELQRPMSK